MENQLPKNWVETTISDFSEIVKTKGNENVTPYLEIGDININTKKYELKDKPSVKGCKMSKINDILISKVRPTRGALTITIDDELNVSSAFTILRFEKFVTSRLVFFQLAYNDSFYNYLGDNCTGTMYPTVTENILKEFKIKVPPLLEQNRIVAKLETLFAQLETIKASMTNIPLLLKDFRQQVLTQAVTGKLTNCKVEEKRLGDLLIDVKYGTSMKSEYEIDGTPIFRIPNINDGEINDIDLKYSILDEKEYNQLKLVEGDILIIRSNGSVSLVGRSAIIREKHNGFAYAGYLIRLRCGEELKPDFLNYTLKSNFLREQIVKTSHSSSGVNNINSQEIKDLKIYWTLPKKQQEIVSRVESLFTKADAIEQQYKLLKQKIDSLPQALLHKALKGELSQQLDSDGDAKELLKDIQELRKQTSKSKKQ